MLQLLHLFLEQPRWEGAAMERSKQQYLSHYRSLSKSLERATADRILEAMLGPDRRFRDPSPEEIAALDLEGMRLAVMRQIHAGNVEVGGSRVGMGGVRRLGLLGGDLSSCLHAPACQLQRLPACLPRQFPLQQTSRRASYRCRLSPSPIPCPAGVGGGRL